MAELRFIRIGAQGVNLTHLLHWWSDAETGTLTLHLRDDAYVTISGFEAQQLLAWLAAVSLTIAE